MFVSQLKAAWASVTPHSSLFLSSASAGERYLYSFFNTGSEKNGFSLKCCDSVYKRLNGVYGAARDVRTPK